MLRINEYKNNKGVNCYLSSFANLISYYNNAIDEASIFFEGNNFILDYSFENKISIAEISLYHEFDDAITYFLKKNGINYVYNEFSGDIVNEKEFFEDRLKKKRPILIFVDSAYLNYSNAYSKEKSRTHVLVVSGISNEGIYVNDCFVPTYPISTYEGFFSYCDLVNSWKKDVWEGEKVRYFDFDYDKLEHLNIKIDMASQVETLKNRINEYFDVNGMAQVEQLKDFASKIGIITQLYSHKVIKEDITELAYKIFVESIVPARLLLAKQMKKIVCLNLFSSCYSYVDAIESLAAQWYKISLLLVKGGFRISDEYFEKVSNRIFGIINQEEKIFYDLYRKL